MIESKRPMLVSLKHLASAVQPRKNSYHHSLQMYVLLTLMNCACYIENWYDKFVRCSLFVVCLYRFKNLETFVPTCNSNWNLCVLSVFHVRLIIKMWLQNLVHRK